MKTSSRNLRPSRIFRTTSQPLATFRRINEPQLVKQRSLVQFINYFCQEGIHIGFMIKAEACEKNAAAESN